MELLLFRFDQWVKLYNCSEVRVDEVPLGERRQMANGTVMLFLFFLFEFLYLPCLIAIWKHRQHSCYQFLFFIGLTDILMLPIQGLVSGIYSLFGVVFCANPPFNFVIASFGAALFAAQTSANFFLALDRLIETISPRLGKVLFADGRAWRWTMASSALGLYYFCMVKPALFSPTYGNWFMNPYQDYASVAVDLKDYISPFAVYYDAFLSFGFPAIYLLFVVFFLRKQEMKKNIQQKQPTTIVVSTHSLFKKITNKNKNCSSGGDYAKIVFVQVAAINGINVATFVLYTVMQHLPMSKSLIVVGFYFNYLMFGIPPIVYLFVNRTIRNECRAMAKKLVKF
ncbi:hypothetical protein niasHS_015104 [Heterodera schachtii]|uniref:Uncharacterized protein n=2 Tax=Heterodera TaxID=34509 RepID=A0ABD2I2H4_HETSC